MFIIMISAHCTDIAYLTNSPSVNMCWTELNRSYFYGDDTKHGTGWGNRSYFTYYSQFNRDQRGIITVEVVFLSLILGVALLFDSGLIVIILRYRRLPTVTSYSIVNFNIAAILLVIGIPFIITTRITGSWKLGKHVCSFLFYTELVSGSVVIWVYCFISFDRFRSIVTPTKRPITAWTAKLILSCIWVFNFLLYIPVAAFCVIREFPFGEGTATICTLFLPRIDSIKISQIVAICILVCTYIIPIILITHNYVRILLALRNLRRKIVSVNTVDQSVTARESMNTRERFRTQRQRKVVRFFILMLVLFVLMYLPIHISIIVITLDGISNVLEMRSDIFLACMCVAFSNSCISPILYGIFNEKVKLSFKLLCSKNVKRKITRNQIVEIHSTSKT